MRHAPHQADGDKEEPDAPADLDRLVRHGEERALGHGLDHQVVHRDRSGRVPELNDKQEFVHPADHGEVTFDRVARDIAFGRREDVWAVVDTLTALVEAEQDEARRVPRLWPVDDVLATDAGAGAKHGRTFGKRQTAADENDRPWLVVAHAKAAR